GEISFARASKRLVSPLIADTTTTSRWPSRWKRAIRRATFLIRSTLPTEVPPYFWTISAMLRIPAAVGDEPQPRSELPERDRRVGAAEAEGIRQRRANGHLARRVGNEIQVAARILPEQVRGGRRDLVADRQHREHRFDAGSGAKQVAGHRLGRRDG